MTALECLAALNRAGFAVTFKPIYSGIGVVEVELTLRHMANHPYESDGPELPIIGTANAWDADSYARALEAFHRIAFPELR